MKKLLSTVCFLLIMFPVFASTVALRSEHPESYTVKANDTIWSIASQFLAEPWQWSALWPKQTPPKNSDIFPGDRFVLTQKNEQPALQWVRSGTVKMSPKVIADPVHMAKQSIPMEIIRPFLSNSRVVVSDKELLTAPHIVAFNENHLTAATGDLVYVRGLPNTKQVMYLVFRDGGKLVDPKTEKILGYQAVKLGNLEVLRFGNPSVLRVLNTLEPLLLGDRLLPQEPVKEVEYDLVPKVPKITINAQVLTPLAVELSDVSQYQALIINRGALAGLSVGDMLTVYRPEIKTIDEKEMTKRRRFRNAVNVTIPLERVGKIMVFRTYKTVSLAVVLDSTQSILKDYIVKN